MFSKTLINLIDNAIFPAVLLFVAKMLSVIFIAQYLGIDYTVNGIRLAFNDEQSYLMVNSYSSLFMLIAVVGGLVWVLIKAHVFHDTHITPSLASKLNDINMNDIIHDTKTIFSQSFIWLSYAWLVTVVLGVQTVYGLSYNWVFWVALIISVISTAALAIDLEREIVKDAVDINDKQKHKYGFATLKDIKKEVFN